MSDTQAPRNDGFFRSGYIGLEAQELKGILNPASSAVKVGVLKGVRMTQEWASKKGNTPDQKPNDVSLRPLCHQLEVRLGSLRKIFDLSENRCGSSSDLGWWLLPPRMVAKIK